MYINLHDMDILTIRISIGMIEYKFEERMADDLENKR